MERPPYETVPYLRLRTADAHVEIGAEPEGVSLASLDAEDRPLVLVRPDMLTDLPGPPPAPSTPSEPWVFLAVFALGVFFCLGCVLIANMTHLVHLTILAN